MGGTEITLTALNLRVCNITFMAPHDAAVVSLSRPPRTALIVDNLPPGLCSSLRCEATTRHHRRHKRDCHTHDMTDCTTTVVVVQHTTGYRILGCLKYDCQSYYLNVSTMMMMMMMMMMIMAMMMMVMVMMMMMMMMTIIIIIITIITIIITIVIITITVNITIVVFTIITAFVRTNCKLWESVYKLSYTICRFIAPNSNQLLIIKSIWLKSTNVIG